jgi:hypothetical protein
MTGSAFFETEEAWEAMPELERAWRDGDLRSLIFAVNICNCHARPLPKWVAEGVRTKLWEVFFSKGNRKFGGVEFKSQNYKHGWRWRQVKRLYAMSPATFKAEIGSKKNWDNIYHAVAQLEIAARGDRPALPMKS